MNTTHDVQGMSFVDFDKLLYRTVLSVAISGFLTIITGELSHWSAPITGVVLWLATTSCSSWAQNSIVNSAVPVRFSRRLPYLFVSSLVGWIVSFLLVYLLIQLTDVSIDSANLGNAVWIGFIAGAIIGLFPGMCMSIAYGWLIRPGDNTKRLFMSNVIGWCLGMGLACASILLLLTIIVGNLISIF